MTVAAPKTTKFTAPCLKCEGTGEWRGDRGGVGECFACGGTGEATVVAKYEKGTGSFGFYVAGKTGRPTKQRYEVAAKLTEPYDRYRSGATVGGGPYCDFLHTNPVGFEVGVHGITIDGELAVAFGDGGYGATGERKRPDYATGGHGNDTVAVEIDDAEIAALVAELREQAKAAGAAVRAGWHERWDRQKRQKGTA